MTKNKARYLLVISGPSGAGKDTVVAHLRTKHPEIEISVSATTRPMREGEAEGVNYYYISQQAFEQKIAEGEMLEYANYCGNYYGTPKSEVDEHIENSTTVVLVIEVQGAGNIKKMYPQCTTVFVCPPSLAELESRLRGRGTESEESIARRMQRAQEEMEMASQYDFQVTNDDIDACAQRIYDILQQRQA